MKVTEIPIDSNETKSFSGGLPDSEYIRNYINQNLEAVLQDALAELAKVKPEDPLLWLANYLLKNNTNTPKVEE
ncbi:hypothetical protein PCE1_000300 [Barthelona sp. PCE]